MSEGTDIETSIDRLLGYVRAKGRVDLYGAAQALAMPAPQVEKVAAMLEQSGLLEVKYSLTGIHLIAKQAPQPPTAPARIEAEKKASFLRQEEEILEREVRDSERILEFVEEDLLKRLHRAEEALTALERADVNDEEELRHLRREIDTLRIEVDATRRRTQLLEHKEEDFLERLAHFAQHLEKLKAREVMLTSAYQRGGGFGRFLASLLEGFKRLLGLRRKNGGMEGVAA